MIVTKWITVDLGINVECKVCIECREGASDETNQLTALNVLKNRVSSTFEKLFKPVSKEGAYGTIKDW